MTYTIEVENVGPESALDITITDELTVEMVLGQIVTSQGGCSETAEPGRFGAWRLCSNPDSRNT